MTGCT